MKWFRMYTDILDDPKMAKLTDAEFRVFSYLLMVAAEEEQEGAIKKTPADISWRLRLSQELIEGTISKLADLKIVDRNGAGVTFINWQKRQFRSDDSTKRWQEWYQRNREKGSNVGSNVDQTLVPTFQNRAEQSREENKDPLSPSQAPPNCPHEEIIRIYHEILPTLPKVKAWTEERKKHLRARWNEDPKRQDQGWWRRYFEHVAKSPFLTGNNERAWMPNLEWLVKQRNLVNVIEGKYHVEKG